MRFQTLNSIEVRLNGANLIEASAGTGKTYTITTLFLRLIVEKRLSVDQILVVTFTEAATAELRDRTRSRLREAYNALVSGSSDDELLNSLCEGWRDLFPHAKRDLKSALQEFDRAAIFTIHGFCRRMLNENAFESGIPFDMELAPDLQALWSEIIYDFWGRETYEASAFFIRHLAGASERYVKGTKKKTAKISAVNLGTLESLGKKVAQQLDIEIAPDESPSDDGFGNFFSAFGKARQTWKAEKADIVKLLHDSAPNLKRDTYRLEQFSDWFDVVDRYFKEEKPAQASVSFDIVKMSSHWLDVKTKKNSITPEHSFFHACEELWDSEEGLLAALCAFKHKMLSFVRKELKSRKAGRNILSFNDLLLSMDRALIIKNSPLKRSILKRYRAALIDEFQDTDQVQYRIFRSLFQQAAKDDTAFFLIGDPKQSIYAFRGADIFAYLDAIRDSGDRLHTLQTNWRSDRGLIQAVNRLFERVQHKPFLVDAIRFEPVRSRPHAGDEFRLGSRKPAQMQILHVPSNEERMGMRGKVITKSWADAGLAAMVAADISHLLDPDAEEPATIAGKIVSPGDIAVLCRSHKQIARVQDALSKLGIPCVASSRASVFSSNEAGQLSLLLKAVANPISRSGLRSALAGEIMNMGANDLLRLNEEENYWHRWAAFFAELHEIWSAKGFIQMFSRLMTHRFEENGPGLSTRILARAGGERSLTNLLHLSELLHDASVRRHLGLEGLHDWFSVMRSSQGEDAEAHELRLESDARAVKILTIHKSKGLEFPVVYCPYLWYTNTFSESEPHPVYHVSNDGDSSTRRILDLDPDDDSRLAAIEEEAAEEMRLLYVALTRARHHLVLLWGGFSDSEKSALAYLLHHPGMESERKDVVKHVKSVIKDGDARILDDLQQLVDEARGSIAVSELGEDDGVPYQRKFDSESSLQCRQALRRLKSDLRTSSFSSLSHSRLSLAPEEAEGLDRDAALASGRLTEATELPVERLNADSVLLADFDRGRRAGNFFHDCYEHLDFTKGEEPEFGEILHERFRLHGYEEEPGAENVTRALRHSLSAELDPNNPGLALNRIATDRRLNELEFLLPVKKGEKQLLFTPGRLADIFRRHHASLPCPDYAQELAALSFVPFTGYLKGFIDLVFEFQDRYYIVDYKSNHLGDYPEDYGQGQLAGAMSEHHYLLQYHLYLVALHRFLKARIADYDYERHIGGVYYLFIRGMTPGADTGHGVFRDRPTRDLVEDLSAFFGGE